MLKRLEWWREDDRYYRFMKKNKRNTVPFEEVMGCLGNWPAALHNGHPIHLTSEHRGHKHLQGFLHIHKGLTTYHFLNVLFINFLYCFVYISKHPVKPLVTLHFSEFNCTYSVLPN